MPSHKNTRRYDIWVYFLKPTIRIFICLLPFLNSWDLFHLLRYHLSMWNKFIFWIKSLRWEYLFSFFFYYRKVFIVLRYFLLLWKTLVHWILSKKKKRKREKWIQSGMNTSKDSERKIYSERSTPLLSNYTL